VALLEVLLRRQGARPGRWWAVEPTRQPARIDADAVLMIGDAGLHADHGGRQVLDLGEAWFQWQQRPFVYAAWLLAATAPADRILPHLRRAYQQALEAKLEDGTGGAVYYRFGDREREGLLEFHREAAALDLCAAEIVPSFL
jgi:predicted solute-binding protein